MTFLSSCPSLRHWVGRLLRALTTVLTASVLVACVSLDVQPLTSRAYPERPGDAPVAVLAEDPPRAHVKLARLTATSGTTDEDALREKILKAAHDLGADAVVLGKVDVRESFARGPMWQSTMGSEVSYGIFGGPGAGTPFTFDPWTYEQSEVDTREYTMYLSGVAIRYTNGRDAGLD